MKIKINFTVFYAILLALLAFAFHNFKHKSTPNGADDNIENRSYVSNDATQTDPDNQNKPADINSVPKKYRYLTNDKSDELEILEKLGYVPKMSKVSVSILAEQTSWWGKRLDPEEFWKDRVIWYDELAEYSARSRGRGYPPMPYDNPSVHDRSDVDQKNDRYHGESQVPRYVSSERERSFWRRFRMSNPNPPKEIQGWLTGAADTWIGFRNMYEHSRKTGVPSDITKSTVEAIMERALRDANTFWYPHEAVSPEAFHWDHVMRKRAEYDEFAASGKVDDERESKWFFDRVLVDRALITEPLTDEQNDAANAWKVAYLKRLRSEEWDESYINAYLQAWDLTEEYVFKSEEVQVTE